MLRRQLLLGNLSLKLLGLEYLGLVKFHLVLLSQELLLLVRLPLQGPLVRLQLLAVSRSTTAATRQRRPHRLAPFATSATPLAIGVATDCHRHGDDDPTETLHHDVILLFQFD